MTRDTSRGRAKVRQVCAAFGISTQAYHKAKKPATPDDGEGGRPRKERRGPWASAAELEGEIRRAVATHPGWGSRKVWARLKREGVVASKNRVWAMMRALGLVLPPVKEREPTVRRGQVVVADSDRRWASDLTTAWTSRDGWAAIVPVIACGDRCGLACDVMKSQEAPMVLSPVARSLTVESGSSTNVPWGLELRTDHGPQYTGNDCEALCKQWNVTHTLAPVGRDLQFLRTNGTLVGGFGGLALQSISSFL